MASQIQGSRLSQPFSVHTLDENIGELIYTQMYTRVHTVTDAFLQVFTYVFVAHAWNAFTMEVVVIQSESDNDMMTAYLL